MGATQQELLVRLQAGDESALADLASTYGAKIQQLAFRYLRNKEDAEDAMQEAFLKAFEHRGEFQGNSRFYTWLVRIAVNQALMKLRKRRTTKEVSLDEDFQADGDMLPREVVDWAPNPEELYRVSELRDILIKALENLRPALRTVFVLRDIEGLSIHQTAEVLELSPAAVKARLLRARLQLRELLNEYFRKTTNMRGPHLGRAQSCVARFPRQDVSPLKLPHGLK